MLKFVNNSNNSPQKKPLNSRKNDFLEIYSIFSKNYATEQSSRCSQCGVPFCQVHCPLHNNIPDWLKLVAENRLEEAHHIASATNNMPEICGRICPQDRLCEGNCVIESSGHGTVTIGAIEKFITENAWDNGWIKPLVIEKEKNQSVGIIGSGPAGLTAAEELRKKGYKITIYDRYDRAGGLLIYGIPNFKLEKEIVLRRTERLKKSGIIFNLNCEIGSSISFDAIQNKHDSVVIASGVYKARKINLNITQASNVLPALEYLTASNRKGLLDKVVKFENGTLNAFDKNVVVVGGGDTAMDCVRTAIRQGAKSVKCLYRRDKKNMPGSKREVQNAIEEGVEFKWLTQPINYIGDKNIKSVSSSKIQLGSTDESGRRIPILSKEEKFEDECDLIIEALGFEPENLPIIFNKPELNITNRGTIKVDFKTMMTDIKGVFAAGDIVRGASLVVWGIKDGRDVAFNVHNFLNNINY